MLNSPPPRNSAREDVRARGAVDRLVHFASEALWLRLEFARARLEPAEVVRPPAAGVLGGLSQPRFGAACQGIREAVRPAAVGIRRVDQRLDVATVHEDEARGSANDLG